MEMERDLRLILLSKMSGGREVSELERKFMNEGKKEMRNNEEGVKRGKNKRGIKENTQICQIVKGVKVDGIQIV